MKYTSINIQGNLISEDILQKIEAADAQGQLAKDFGFEPGINLRSEIEYAWSRVKLDWKHFTERSEKLPSSDPYGTTITRRWMTGFFSTLGFDLTLQKSSLTGDNEKSYNISHTCQALDGLPVHITGFFDPNHPEKNTLDIRSSGGTSRLSPHATIQEYLNVTEYLYALVTNGLMLRLVRDSGRLVKLTYIEFDLKRLLDEDKYSEFTLLYRLLHASRFPNSKQETEESFLEKYYQDSIESGNRIRDGLSDAVKSSLIALGNGLLGHPENDELREKIKSGIPDAREFYHQLLRLIYRLLFLMVTEERDLVFSDIQVDDKEPDKDDLMKGSRRPGRKQKDIYYRYYSLIRLRKLSEKRYLQENQFTDLWQGLMQTFALFESGGSGHKLGILALGSELFSGNAMPDISSSKVNNKVLLQCIRSLNEFEDERHNLSFINYRALDVEELGSVYEGLLELEPVFEWGNGKPTFTFKQGTERSSSGSHYTPEDLVKPLIQHSLEYLIEERVDSGEWVVVSSKDSDIEFNIGPYEIIKKLSGVNSLAEINKIGKNDLFFYKVLSERRDIWIDFANKKGGREHSGEHSGGPGTEHHGRISPVSGDSQRFSGGIRDFTDTLKGIGLSDDRAIRQFTHELRRDSQTTQRINQLIKEITTHYPLSTNHYPLTTTHYQLKLSTRPIIQKLLDLKVCDVACGSGHILLSAARRIALEVARVETGEQQPNPASFRHALKEVIRNCIYGVDKNPLAVELCKVALWLESHNPGEPLSFLDHRIKCGDAIVGLAHREELQNGIADEAFKKLPGDDKDIVSVYARKNKQERTLREKSKQAVQLTTETDHKLMRQVTELNEAIDNFSRLPENTSDEIEQKEKAYRKLINNETLKRLKVLADLQVMPFFLDKTERNKEYLLTDAQYQRYLRGEIRTPSQLEVKAIEIATNYRFFHWFLEFPEVFQKSGFDCILGNPPFLGDRRLREAFGENYLEWLRYNFSKGTTVDLVVYFFLRINSIITNNGFQSLISTNTVAQGKARETGLETIINKGSSIIHAVKSIRWPGIAAVEVSLIALYKGKWKKDCYLGKRLVKYISSHLDDTFSIGEPFQLLKNHNKSFQGTIVLGNGFVIDRTKKQQLIEINSRNAEVIFPFMNGEDLNNQPDLSPSRWVLNFRCWPLNRATNEDWIQLNEDERKKLEEKHLLVDPSYSEPVASDYKECIDIINIKVKLERHIKSEESSQYPYWWFWRPRIELYKKIEKLDRVLIAVRISKYFNIAVLPKNYIYNDKCIVFAEDSFSKFCILLSNVHIEWAWKYSTTLGSTTIVYTPGNCYDTFPFEFDSEKEGILEFHGKAYHEHRKKLLLSLKLGLTKTYNAFHSKEISEELNSEKLLNLDKKAIEKKYGKEVWSLWNHLQRTEDTCSFEEAVKGIIKLRDLHVEMDKAVLIAYGWQDIDLRHDFYEVDYLPEKDRVRFTIHPDARKEVLKRLLELNHKIHEEEVKAGLWDEKKTKKKKAGSSDPNGVQVNEPEAGYGGLFD